MKYVITGGAGHISKPLAEILLKAGHEVTVVGRNADNLKSLTDQGATAAIGSVEDVEFLKKTFTGADAVYTMIPPNFGATDWKGFIGQIGANYAEAIKTSGVKHVVNLSSVGAHMEDGCGPVSGLYRAEKALNELQDVAIKHLRPGFFYYNLMSNIPMIKGMNILGGNFGDASTTAVLASTDDIAEVAAEELLNLNFTGKSIRYIVSDERTWGDVAKTLGQAVGKPELPWVGFSDEQTLGGLQQVGLPDEIAKNYTEMGVAMRTGAMTEDYYKNKPSTFGKVKLEDFAKQFSGAYNAS
jgi:uncharacterized protein YbjT (DUF2867 family)